MAPRPDRAPHQPSIQNARSGNVTCAHGLARASCTTHIVHTRTFRGKAHPWRSGFDGPLCMHVPDCGTDLGSASCTPLSARSNDAQAATWHECTCNKYAYGRAARFLSVRCAQMTAGRTSFERDGYLHELLVPCASHSVRAFEHRAGAPSVHGQCRRSADSAAGRVVHGLRASCRCRCRLRHVARPANKADKRTARGAARPSCSRCATEPTRVSGSSRLKSYHSVESSVRRYLASSGARG